MGLFLGAVPTAFAIMVLGSLFRPPIPEGIRQATVAVIAGVLLVREFGLVNFPVPQNARLVSQFVTRVPFWGALQFGTEMGTGMRTFSPTGLPHVVAVAVLLLASWPQAIMVGLGFATGRTLMLLTFLTAPDKTRADASFVSTVPRLRPVFAIMMIPVAAMLLLG